MTVKSLKETLAKEYPIRIELHAHTKPVSGCSEVLPEEMVRIYNGKGYDGVVITNHFYHSENKKEYIECFKNFDNGTDVLIEDELGTIVVWSKTYSKVRI